jgi:hypothetical protein
VTSTPTKTATATATRTATPTATATADPLCGDYKVVSWTGTIGETGDNSCNGMTSYTLDSTPSQPNIFHFVSDGAGGCSVNGSITMQGATPCQNWSGIWVCSGAVTPAGSLSIGCACLTQMFVGGAATGSAQGQTYSGGWNFTESGTTDGGDNFTDNGSGTFLMNPLSNGSSVLKPGDGDDVLLLRLIEGKNRSP